MPFQPTNYATIEPQGNPWVRNFVENLTKGYQAGRLPYETGQLEQKQNLANAMSQMLNKEQPQKFQSEMANDVSTRAYQGANTNKINEMLPLEIAKAKLESSLPFGGKIAPGSVGQAMWLDMIGKKYGQNSPEYNSAKQAYDVDINKANVLNAYRNELTNTTQKRASTPQGKEYQEMDDIANGFMPGTGRKETIPPEKQQEMEAQYALKMQKQNTDAQTRQKTLFASNIDKTIGMINPEHLTQYGGVKGQANLKADMLSSAFGKPTENYRNYQKALTNATLLSKQVRQFYGDSIQPVVAEKLAQLTNPATWQNDPKVAMDNYKAFIKTLKNETGTYRNALKSTKEYQGNSDNSSGINSGRVFNLGTGAFE